MCVNEAFVAESKYFRRTWGLFWDPQNYSQMLYMDFGDCIAICIKTKLLNKKILLS